MLAPCRALVQGASECRVVGDGVEGVGVEQQARYVCQQVRQRLGDGVPPAAAAHDRGAPQRGGIHLPGCVAQHQFGHRRPPSRIERAGPDAPGAGGQGCMCGQVEGALHADRAADDVEVAEAALVMGMPPHRQTRCGRIAAGAQPRRGRGGLHAEIVEPDLAGVIPASGSEEPGLEREQRKRPARADRLLAGHVALIGRKPRGQVDRQHRVLTAVDGRDGLGQPPLRRTGGAEAEQAVDQQIHRAEFSEVVDPRQGRGAGLLPGVGSIRGQAVGVGQRQRRHGNTLALQMQGRDQGIAPVVARPHKHAHTPGMGGNGQRQAGRCKARAGHQRVRRRGAKGCCFQPAGAGDVVQGPGMRGGQDPAWSIVHG